MLDISKKPTTADIERKARLLYYFASANDELATNTRYNDIENIDTLEANAEILKEMTLELWIMAQVLDGYAKFSDFPQLIPEEQKKAAEPCTKSRVQLMDELYSALSDLAGVKKPAADPKQRDGEPK